MPKKTQHALIILDMLNLFDFPEARQLIGAAEVAAKNIKKLKDKFKKKNWPIIYVNDHFGNWHSDWKKLFVACIDEKRLGRNIALILEPDEDDYFILKPKHSGFFHTSLELLLNTLNIRNLVLTGVAGNICVLFTAHDAYMREYKVKVVSDAVASNTKKDNAYALNQLKKALGIKVVTTKNVR